MSQILLSILIPTVVGREDSLNNGFFKESKDKIPNSYVTGYLEVQVGDLEFIILKDNKEMTIGEKREKLYQKARGAFSWQIDDDDDIAPNAIELILEAIKSNPEVDCITFEERVRLDGLEYKSNHSLSYSGWIGDGSKELSDGFHFWRTPFFKSVIKTEIAKSVPIPHCRWGEDNMWADELHKVLKTEHHINQQLYYYDYISSPHNERYGIK